MFSLDSEISGVMNFGFCFRKQSKQKIIMDSDASLLEKYRFRNVFIVITAQLRV